MRIALCSRFALHRVLQEVCSPQGSALHKAHLLRCAYSKAFTPRRPAQRCLPQDLPLSRRSPRGACSKVDHKAAYCKELTNTEHTKLKAGGQNSKETHVWVKQTTQTGKEEERNSKRIGVLRFFDGCRINDDETPKGLEIEPDDVIRAFESTESTTGSLHPTSPTSLGPLVGADSPPQDLARDKDFAQDRDFAQDGDYAQDRDFAQ